MTDPIKRAILEWIRDTAPVAAKLTLIPCHVAALTDGIRDALHDAGLAIVPREATRAQLAAGRDAWITDPQRRSSTIYRAKAWATRRQKYGEQGHK